jgi:hypothetical protein
MKIRDYQNIRLKMVLTGHAPVRTHLRNMGLVPADSTGRRMKQRNILTATARRWLVSALMSLGI